MKIFKAASTTAASPRPKSAPRTAPRAGAGESIRGKISGPIPIPNPMDDDEFPIRNPGSAVASNTPDDEFPIRPRGASIASPVPPEDDEKKGAPPTQAQEDSTVSAGQNSSGSTRPDAPLGNGSAVESSSEPPPAAASPVPPVPARAPPASVSASPTASGSGASPTHKRTNPSSTLRYSIVSSVSGSAVPSGESKPQRKKSTLRGALSKLFGRKKKNGSSQSSGVGDSDRTSSYMPSPSQHRSDTSGLVRIKESEPKRSASLPITEYDRALRSHSIGPGDMNAIESARTSMQTDHASAGRRRAATSTNSRLWGPAALRRAEMGEYGGLSPRPVSTHGRSSRMMVGEDDEEDPDTIGRAITSDMGVGLTVRGNGGEYTYRRRSRSLCGIDGGEPQGEPRRRSDEIRYWRESYGASFLSPVSSTHPENQGDNGATTSGDNDNDNDDTGVLSMDLGLSPPGATSAAASGSATDSRSQNNQHAQTPPEPFNFGNLATMNQMAGMKITQAADFEMRIGGLESRMQGLERVVDQLCHAVPGFKAPLPSTSGDVPRSMQSARADTASFTFGTSVSPPVLPAAYQALVGGGADASSRTSSRRHSVDTGDGYSHMSFGEGQTYIGSLYPPSSSATQSLSVPAVAGSGPSPSTPPRDEYSPDVRARGSTSTVRGATSMPALAAVSAEHAEALMAQVEAERAARAALEQQVKKLSERLNTLSSTMYAMVRDPHRARSQEQLTPTPTPTPGGNSQRITPTKLGLMTTPTLPSPAIMLGATAPPRVPQTTDKAADKTKTQGSSFDDDVSDDEDSNFLTPREEQPPSRIDDEVDDDEGAVDEDDDDSKRKKAARTLSLSQLTLGRGQRNVI